MITVKDPSDGITHAVLPACTSLPKAENPMQLKPRPAGPKVAFPPSHLPELLRLIDGNTKIRTDLVSQLKAHFDAVTSKAAIEAKIREVAARQGKAKDSQWRVLPEAWVRFPDTCEKQLLTYLAGCCWATASWHGCHGH